MEPNPIRATAGPDPDADLPAGRAASEPASPSLHVRLFGAFELVLDGQPVAEPRAAKDQWLFALLLLSPKRPRRRDLIAQTLWPFPDFDAERAGANLRRSLVALRKALGLQSYRLMSPSPDTLSVDLTDAFVDVSEFDRAVAAGDRASLERAVSLHRAPLLLACLEIWVRPERERRQDQYEQARQKLKAEPFPHEQPDALPAVSPAASAPSSLRTLTFLFTDIEDSTRLWEQHPEAMRLALAHHDGVMAEAIAAQGGSVFKRIGDAFCAAFHTAQDAIETALAVQQSLHGEPATEPIVLKVRMALHTGAAEARDHDYFGQPLNRIARLLAAGHGGQVLISAATQELVRDSLPPDCSLLSVGLHRLRNLDRPESVYQLLHPALPSTFPPLKSRDRLELRHNLPVQVTSFIGREREIAEVRTLLEKTHLLTLTGSGGCGKTRLALQVAAEALDETPEGVWLVELAALTDPTLVAQTVAQALGVKEQQGETIAQTLMESLKSRSLLLILDNCEHLLSACAQLASTLLRSCPQVKVLATSREALGIAGEQTYRVPPLSFPDLSQRSTAQSLSQYEAVRLFIERAMLVKSDFAVSNQNAPALAQLCYRLDGIPLAVELAAAQTRSLVVEDINARLDSRFRLLTRGDRSALPRQQTLRALIDWSYDLLNDQEKRLLIRLSVFAGGWTLEAAEQVGATDEGVESGEWGVGTAPQAQPLPPTPYSLLPTPYSLLPTPSSLRPDDVLDLLTSLVDKSLVNTEEQEGSTRYRMLETVRQYAIERLQRSGETPQVRGRHADWFLAFAEEAEVHLTAPEQTIWLRRLAREHDNLRAALAWYAADPEGAEAGLRLAGALWRFWYQHNHFSEGMEHLSRSLQREEARARNLARAKALNGESAMAYSLGDYSRSRTLTEECLTLRRELGDRVGVARSVNNLGLVTQSQGDYLAARALFEESLAMSRELGNQAGISLALANLGSAARDMGEHAAARKLHEESLTIARKLEDKDAIAWSLYNLGHVVCQQGEHDLARRLLEESLAVSQELEDLQANAHSLYCLGLVAGRQGNPDMAMRLHEESLAQFRKTGDLRHVARSLEGLAAMKLRQDASKAVCLWGAAHALRASIGAPLPPYDRERYEQELSQARSALDEDAFAALWEEGRSLNWGQAVSFALGESTP